MTIGMHHIGVYCSDIDKSLHFYADVLDFRLLFTTVAYEGDKPLKMAWIRNGDIIIELLEQSDKSVLEAHRKSLNHFSIRTDDMNAFVEHLASHGIDMEAGPFDTGCEFDRKLDAADSDVFTKYGDKGVKLTIAFFRGPAGERIEAVQDNRGELT